MTKYMFGMVTGLVVGTTVGMMVMPQLDRKTQKNVKRAGQRMMNLAEDSYDSMMSRFY